MQAGPLKASPSLFFLGLAVMDELCARHMASPVLY
ncbi:DNA replication protein [Klebsiella michiganensis]|nr:DNA replication protein [Klebsiella michiganensis]STR65394.1 DNA replication protein [Klebsiella michiganensis]